MYRVSTGWLIVAGIIAVSVSARSQDGHQATVSNDVTAVCIEHLGVEDKPITSIAIGTSAKAETECKREFYHDRVDVCQLSQKQMMAFVDRLHRFTDENPSRRSCNQFGTFKWVILSGGQRTKVLTCPDDSVRLLSDLLDASEDKKLRDALRYTLLRLGVRK